jgi:hypothetical protein
VIEHSRPLPVRYPAAVQLDLPFLRAEPAAPAIDYFRTRRM